MMRCWIAVASHEHVRIGRAGGFMQVCHGKGTPLRRLRPGDMVVYYSPTETFGAADGLQAFTALGAVQPGEPYQANMGNGFRPFRRDVAWVDGVRTAPIRPLLARLQFTAGQRNWGAPFRYGLVEIDAADLAVIAAAMGAGSDERQVVLADDVLQPLVRVVEAPAQFAGA